MKFEPPLTPAILQRRYKRFLADVVLENGEALTVHCANTGAMTGCDIPDSNVWLNHSSNPKRKYAYTLEQVQGEWGRAGVNTARANMLVKEALAQDAISELAGYRSVQPEATIPGGSGRFDFLLREHADHATDCYVEVKSVTLAAAGGLGLFPDAVSARALKHLQALEQVRANGQRAVLLFCVQHDGVQRVAPAEQVDPEYAKALRRAATAGVEVLAYRAQLTATETRIDQALPVLLSAD